MAVGSMRAPQPTTAAGTSTPVANAGPLGGEGELAFVSDRHLYLIGGPVDHLVRVGLSGPASDPTWSHDGGYLAVATAPKRGASPTAVWLVAPSGNVVRRLTPKGGTVNGFSWSPVANRLEVVVTDRGHDTVELIRADGNVRRVLRSSYVSGASWSPDGSKLAIGTSTFGRGSYRSALRVVPAAGGHGRVITTEKRNVLEVAGWWPDGSGVLVRLDYLGSGSLEADGLPLLDISAASGHRRRLAKTALAYDAWLSTSAKRDEVAFIAGGDRELTLGGKHLEVCGTTACHEVTQPKDQVSFDPAFNAAGTLAVVRDRAITPHTFGMGFALKVADSGHVSVVQPGSVTPLREAGAGATSPVWSRDGALLVVRGRYLWIAAVGYDKPQRVAGPLQVPSNYYGFVPWQSSFAWAGAVGQD